MVAAGVANEVQVSEGIVKELGKTGTSCSMKGELQIAKKSYKLRGERSPITGLWESLFRARNIYRRLASLSILSGEGGGAGKGGKNVMENRIRTQSRRGRTRLRT